MTAQASSPPPALASEAESHVVSNLLGIPPPPNTGTGGQNLHCSQSPRLVPHQCRHQKLRATWLPTSQASPPSIVSVCFSTHEGIGCWESCRPWPPNFLSSQHWHQRLRVTLFPVSEASPPHQHQKLRVMGFATSWVFPPPHCCWWYHQDPCGSWPPTWGPPRLPSIQWWCWWGPCNSWPHQDAEALPPTPTRIIHSCGPAEEVKVLFGGDLNPLGFPVPMWGQNIPSLTGFCSGRKSHCVSWIAQRS